MPPKSLGNSVLSSYNTATLSRPSNPIKYPSSKITFCRALGFRSLPPFILPSSSPVTMTTAKRAFWAFSTNLPRRSRPLFGWSLSVMGCRSVWESIKFLTSKRRVSLRPWTINILSWVCSLSVFSFFVLPCTSIRLIDYNHILVCLSSMSKSYEQVVKLHSSLIEKQADWMVSAMRIF